MTLVISDRDPLKPVSQYEQIAAQVELDRFKIKLPERTARLIIESPSLAQIDPELEDFEGFQRRKAAEEAKRAQLQQVAQETGAPMHLLRALDQPPSNVTIDTTAYDAQRTRATQIGLNEEMMKLENAIMVQNNVQNVANQAIGMLNQAHVVNPIYEIPRARASPWEFILAEADDDQLPTQYAQTRVPRLPLPAVPAREDRNDRVAQSSLTPNRDIDYERGARALLEAGLTDTSTSSIDYIAPVAEGVARGLFQVASSSAPIVGQGIMAGGRLGNRALMGGFNLTSAASRGVANALSSLAQAKTPLSHRGHDHLERAGINISVQDFVASHRI
jgi:hypothetical protein